jgi:hypothetical protein
VGLPFRPAVPPEADLFGIISAEFVAEKLTVCRAPWLHFAIHDRQALSAKCTAGRYVFSREAFTHFLVLNPRNPIRMRLSTRLPYL